MERLPAIRIAGARIHINARTRTRARENRQRRKLKRGEKKKRILISCQKATPPKKKQRSLYYFRGDSPPTARPPFQAPPGALKDAPGLPPGNVRIMHIMPCCTKQQDITLAIMRHCRTGYFLTEKPLGKGLTKGGSASLATEPGTTGKRSGDSRTEPPMR